MFVTQNTNKPLQPKSNFIFGKKSPLPLKFNKTLKLDFYSRETKKRRNFDAKMTKISSKMIGTESLR